MWLPAARVLDVLVRDGTQLECQQYTPLKVVPCAFWSAWFISRSYPTTKALPASRSQAASLT